MTARKDDSGKAPMELLPQSVLVDVARVLDFGAKKYGKHNWKKGIEYTRLVGAVYRHLAAWMEGQDLDQESGLSHLDHAICSLMFLSWYKDKSHGTDNRHMDKEYYEFSNDIKNDISIYYDEFGKLTNKQIDRLRYWARRHHSNQTVAKADNEGMLYED